MGSVITSYCDELAMHYYWISKAIYRLRDGYDIVQLDYASYRQRRFIVVTNRSREGGWRFGMPIYGVLDL